VTIGGSFRSKVTKDIQIGSSLQKMEDHEIEATSNDKVSSVFQKWKQSESNKKADSNDSNQSKPDYIRLHFRNNSIY